jgi:flagellar hook assembly protein FlgD
LVLSGVAVSPNPVDPRNGQVLNIYYGVNRPAKVTVFIYDKQLRTVYEFPEQAVASASSVQWDGRTSRGTPAPPGAYVVSLVATDGQAVVSQTIEVTVTNKGGNVPGNTSPRGRAR